MWLHSSPRRRWAWLGIFGLCVAVAGAASLLIGKDVNWDLRNYHYYNAFAFLNGRFGWDLAPAQIQTYFNPLGDFPFYALVNVMPGPRSVAFAMALPTAIAAFFLLRMLPPLFAGSTVDRLLCIFCAAAIGLTAATGLSEVGSTMNEWLSAAFLMPGLYFMLRSVAGQDVGRDATVAGLLAGFATGLKLPNAVFALGMAAAIFVAAPAERRFRLTGFAVLGMTAGFLVSYGWWAWVLQQQYGSPVFPFFNAIFQSPWYEAENWRDRGLGPRNAWEALIIPYLVGRGSKIVSNVALRDYRLATLAMVGVLVLAAIIWRRMRRVEPAPTSREWLALTTFVLVAYLTWLAIFGVHRYLLLLELVSGALIVAGFAYLVPSRTAARAVILVVAVLLIGTTRKPGWERVPFGDRYFALEVPALEAHALVILSTDVPASYAISSFRADARFVAPSNNFITPEQGNRLAKAIAMLVRRHEGPLYLLGLRGRPLPAWLSSYGLESKGDGCQVVRSDADADALQVCTLRRM